jgi:tRNA C32,U32 (ribose-2'-O)-methylase TrmJ
MLAEIRAGLSATGYPAHGDPLEEEMGKLSDILNRAALEDWEVNFLLGIVHHLKSRAVNLSQIRQVGTEQEANSGQLSEA